MKRFYFLAITFILLSSCTSAQPNREIPLQLVSSDTINLEKHNDLTTKWNETNIKSYQMIVSYNTFSPKKGLWKIKVENNTLISWEFNGNVNQQIEKEFATMLIQKNLYNLAKEAYNSNSTSLYIISVKYNLLGYIEEITKKINPDIKEIKPTDKGFRIKIIDFKH